MKLCIITRADTRRKPPVDAIWGPLCERCDADIRMLTKEQMLALPRSVNPDDFAAYDRVLVDLTFRYIRRHARFLRQIPNVCIFEQDAYQDFLPRHRMRGAFRKFYRLAQPHCVMVTGHRHALAFRELGINAHFVSKGYAHDQVWEEPCPRDISFGFIGRCESRTYRSRKAFLDAFACHFPLRLLRTESAAEYRQTLSSIRVFVSADIDFGEHMAKNLEAMACGCLLLAKRHGLDDWALGFQDMVNVVLYDDLLEARTKLTYLEDHPDQIGAIADAGKQLVRERHTLVAKAGEVLNILRS